MERLEQRERLIELLNDKTRPWNYLLCPENIRSLADYLLENGVILPPCNVGDTVYFTKAHFGFLPTPKAEKIRKIELYDIDVIFRTESRAFNDKAIGSTVFLTKEEAEKELERMKENG